MRFPSSNVSTGVRPQHIFPDEFAHYYSEPAIHQDPIVMKQDHHITFCGTLPDKTRSGSFYGTARRYHWFAVTLPSFSYAQCHLSPDKAGNRAAPLYRSIRFLCQYPQHRQAMRLIKRQYTIIQ